ncbi:MAG: hypothetical protein GC161_11090 [Planctomycetaceae bacterium]|nr:hypothetical protein [Planctomycetaceae bacterium]
MEPQQKRPGRTASAGEARPAPWIAGLALVAVAAVGWLVTRPARPEHAATADPAAARQTAAQAEVESLEETPLGEAPHDARAALETPIAGRILLATTGRSIPKLDGVLRLRVQHAEIDAGRSELLELPIVDGAWVGPVLPESFAAHVTGVELGDVSVTHITPSLFTAADLPVDLVVKLADFVELVALDADSKAPLRDVSVWVRPTGGSVQSLLSDERRWHQFRRAPPSKQWDDLVAALVHSPVRVESIRASDRWIVGAPGYAPTLVEPVALPTERYEVLLERSGVLRLATDSLDEAAELKLFYPAVAPAEPGGLPHGALLADLSVEPRAGDKDIDLVPGAYGVAWRSEGEPNWMYASVDLHAGEVEELRFHALEVPTEERAYLTLEFVFEKPVARAPRIRLSAQGRGLAQPYSSLVLDTVQFDGANLEQVWSTEDHSVPIGSYSATLLDQGYSYAIEVAPHTNHYGFEVPAEETRRIWVLDANNQKPVKKVWFSHGTIPERQAGSPTLAWPHFETLREAPGKLVRATGGTFELASVVGTLFYVAMADGYGVASGELDIRYGVHEYTITVEPSTEIELRVTFRGQPIDPPSDWLPRVAVFDVDGNPIPIVSRRGEKRLAGPALTTSGSPQITNQRMGTNSPSDSVHLLGVGAATGSAIVRAPALEGIAAGTEVAVELVPGQRTRATIALQ